MKNLQKYKQTNFFVASSIGLLVFFLFTVLAVKAGPGRDVNFESENECAESFDFSISPAPAKNVEFNTVEKSNFNTALLPSYYSEMESDPQTKKVLLVIFDVLGREAYTRAILDRQAFISSLNLENNLCAGVYMIFGASDQRYYKQKLAIE